MTAEAESLSTSATLVVFSPAVDGWCVLTAGSQSRRRERTESLNRERISSCSSLARDEVKSSPLRDW